MLSLCSFNHRLKVLCSVGACGAPTESSGPFHPSGSSQCTSPKHPVSCIEPGLATRFIHDILPYQVALFICPGVPEARASGVAECQLWQRRPTPRYLSPGKTEQGTNT